MKTKNKVLAIVEIAIVLCSVFLVALPAIAADQDSQKASATEVTTASEDDYVLEIYGNANEDDTIDMGDVVYTKLAIFGKKPKTELCDAKYDGRINVLDVIQTKLIILGKEKELTLIDTDERIVTVRKPLNRVLSLSPKGLETMRSIGVQKDILVGVAGKNKWDSTFLSEFNDLPTIGWWWNPDIEAILALQPDTFFLRSDHRSDSVQRALESADPSISVLRFWYINPDMYPDEVKKFGYIFGKVSEAEDFIDWYECIMNTVKEKADSISEEDKPKVYFEVRKPYSIWGEHAGIANAGGIDIFADQGGASVVVNAEDVMERNPDIIVKVLWPGGGYGLGVDDTAELKAAREEIMNRPELQNVKAVKNKRVYIITPHIWTHYSVCGCRHFVQIAYMAKWFHPTLFEDMDPKAIHQEYLTRFQGLDIDLDKKGVFVYPEAE